MELLKPSALKPGDRIGLICPASAPVDPDQLEAAVTAIQGKGYEVCLGRHVRARHGAFAGMDSQRVTDLNEFLRDPSIRMVMAIRGGYGCARLLSDIDYRAILRDPKWLVGYSDVTALQMGMLACAGLVSVSGPMAGVDFCREMDPFTSRHFWSLVTGEPEGRDLSNPQGQPWELVRGGAAEGPLIGGCFSLVMSLFGTRFLPSLDGSILVLEDIHEHIHRVDRMLVQLRLAGVLDRISGLVLGYFTDCNAVDSGHPAQSLDEVTSELLADLRVPCIRGYAYGHEFPKRSLPWGIRARLDADLGKFALLESANSGV